MSIQNMFFKDIEDESKILIKKEVDSFISDKTFNLSDCDFLIKELTERIKIKLLKLSDNFKYIINVVFLQNSNKGFTQKFDAYFENETDGIISLHFPFEKITCIVNLIALSI